MSARLRKMVFAFVGSVVLLFVCGIWFVRSRISSGYEVSGDEVVFRSFDNLTWSVRRSPVQGADGRRMVTVSHSGGLYGSDGTSVFFGPEFIKDADCASFEVLDWRRELSRDANRVYWKSIPMSDEPEHFEMLEGGYSRDSNHVYYGSKPVEGADPDTFVVVEATTSHAKDQSQHYKMGRAVQ